MFLWMIATLAPQKIIIIIIIIILCRYLVLVGLANRAEEAVGKSRLEKSPVHIYKWKWTQTGRDFEPANDRHVELFMVSLGPATY
jgi:phosphatidylglycerophosphate synthase